MKSFRFISILLATVLASACLSETMEPVGHPSGSIPVLSISCNDMTPVQMTKADNINQLLSDVRDLNILVHSNDGQFCSVYADAKTLMVDGTAVPANNETAFFINGYDLNSILSNKQVRLHLGKMTAEQIKKIEVIANYGSDLSKTTDWSTLKETGEFDPKKGYCLMYGVTQAPSGENVHDNLACKYFNIQLKRTRAMVSVKMINDGLNPGVTITPVKLRLCNVPKECQLVALDPAVGNRIVTKAESLPISEETLVSLGSLSGGGTGVIENVKPELGVHDTDGPIREDFMLYLYENRQGKTAAANTVHATKYPEGITSVADAKDPEKNFKASYIEIDAEYTYRVQDSNSPYFGKVKIGGIIKYRFYLGENATDDFNVHGNHYYKVNLHLKGFGGAKEDGKTDAQGNLVVNDTDASWRVDMATKDWGFEKSKFDFDSHLIDASVNVIGNNWTFTKVIRGDGSASWLMLNIRYGGLDYANPTTIIQKNIPFNIVDGKLRFSIQPMYYGEEGIDPQGAFTLTTYKEARNYREMELEVMNMDTGALDTVLVRQYAPIPFQIASGNWLFMERFEEYEGGVYGYPWKYQGNNLSALHVDDGNGSSLSVYGKSYFWGTSPTKDEVGENSTFLSPKKGWNSNWTDIIEYDGEGRGSAAFACYRKGFQGQQGAGAQYYALPSQEMMTAMHKKSLEYDPSWGPFEPVHPYEDYWTSSVMQNTPTQSIFYDSATRTYISTPERNLLKRVRAIYTVQNVTVTK